MDTKKINTRATKIERMLVSIFFLALFTVGAAWAEEHKTQWRVSWIVTNTWIVPCDHGPVECYSEFGEKFISHATTLECCWDSEVLHKSRDFVIHEDANAFIARGKKSCVGKYQCALSNWKIEKIVITEEQEK